MTSLADQPAFPCPAAPRDMDNGDRLHYGQDGMTYRQWLVGMALQGLLANSTLVVRDDNEYRPLTDTEFGERADSLADAAIKAQEDSRG